MSPPKTRSRVINITAVIRRRVNRVDDHSSRSPSETRAPLVWEMTTAGPASCPCERNSAGMTRSRSWPMLYTVLEEDTAAVCCGAAVTPAAAAAATEVGLRQPAAVPTTENCRARQQLQHVPAANVGRLLRRHYYPEAGWGWVVVACACMVHLLNHGLQLSYAALEADVVHKFRDATYIRTGQAPQRFCRFAIVLFVTGVINGRAQWTFSTKKK